MNPVEAILQIRQLFEDLPKEGEATKVVMEEYTLKDGTKVSVSALEVGGEVKLEDGSNAPNGEHELADGQVIVVAEGKITELKPKEEEGVEVEIEAEKKIDEKMQQVKEEFNQMIVKLQSEKDALEKQVSEMNQKMKSGFSQVVELIESISNVPQADPIEKPTNYQFKSSNDIKLERINRYRQAILSATKNN